jgi:hypothetical protein
VKLGNTVRVELNDTSIGLFFEEGFDARLQATDVLLCACEPALSEPLHDSRSDIGIVLSKVSGAREGVALMKRERN